MEALRSYVVRVYRHESDEVAGLIESVETGEVTRFRSSEELWIALCGPASTRRSLPSNTSDPEDAK